MFLCGVLYIVVLTRGRIFCFLFSWQLEQLEPETAYLNAVCSDMDRSSGFNGVFGLRNRIPRWSQVANLHTLEFEGRDRVLEPSRKNLALTDIRDAGMVLEGEEHGEHASEWFSERQSSAILQLGKMGEGRFSLDFRSPLSPFQAMAIAVSTFES